MSVIFRDRVLKSSEKSHYVCSECGCELHPDMAYFHKCSPLAISERLNNDFYGVDNMNNKVNWKCKKCVREFVWMVSRPAETEEERQHLKNYGFDPEVEDYNAVPRNEKGWGKAELYDVTEPNEPELVSESDDSGYCAKCKLKIKELME